MKNGNVKTFNGTITEVETLGTSLHKLTITKGEESIDLMYSGVNSWIASKFKGEEVVASYLEGTDQCVGLGSVADPVVKKAKKK